MNLSIKPQLRNIKQNFPNWKTPSKIIGEAIEDWVCQNMSCPICKEPKCKHCGTRTLQKLPASFKSADLVCTKCHTKVQVKAKKNSFFTVDGQVKKIIGAEYTTTLESFQKSIHYYLISYSLEKMVVNEVYHISPKNLKPKQVVPRKPLSEDAKRAGWQGCYLHFEKDILNSKTPPKQLLLFGDEGE